MYRCVDGYGIYRGAARFTSLPNYYIFDDVKLPSYVRSSWCYVSCFYFLKKLNNNNEIKILLLMFEMFIYIWTLFSAHVQWCVYPPTGAYVLCMAAGIVMLQGKYDLFFVHWVLCSHDHDQIILLRYMFNVVKVNCKQR